MLKLLLRANLILVVLITPFYFLLEKDSFTALVTGVVLSTVFVVSSIWIIHRFWDIGDRKFMKVFFISMGLRFVLVLAAFGILIGTTKIDEIYFTVSFIISYLYQSVTEMIFIHKILHKRSSEK